jgi:hypothetical protein
MDAVRKRILRRIDERADKGVTLKSVSLAMGKNAAYLHQFVHRNIPLHLKERDRMKLAEILDFTEEELGAPAAYQPRGEGLQQIEEIDVKGGAGGGGGIQFSEQNKPENGIAVSADAIRDYWGLPDYYIKGELKIRRIAAKLIEVYGDSMYDPSNPGAPGSLFPGDRVIIDTADRRPSPAGAFALWDGIAVVIKMVEIVPRTDPIRVRLLSRNPIYSPYEATEGEANIIGRVRARITAM